MDAQGIVLEKNRPLFSWLKPLRSFYQYYEDRSQLLQLLPYRGEMLLISKISQETLIPWIELTGNYKVASRKFFYPHWLKGHFPGKPIVPGVIIAEMAHQLGIALVKLSEDRPINSDHQPEVDFMLKRDEKLEYRRSVSAGQTVETKVTLTDRQENEFSFIFQSHLLNGPNRKKLCAEGAFIGVRIKS